MDVAFPIRAVAPTLDGPVLAAISRVDRSLTGREVHGLVGIGSPAGVRLALARLVRQGLVHAEPRHTAVFYTANRRHLAWKAVEELANLRLTLLDRLRKLFRRWSPPAAHASMFGSAARGDGDADSDIDILLVRPDGVDEDNRAWARQVDQLRSDVQRWTGNRCQVFQLDLQRLAEHMDAQDPIVDEWRRDALWLAGYEKRALLGGTLVKERRT